MILAYRRSFLKVSFSFLLIILILIFLLLLSVISLDFIQKYQENAMASSMEVEELEEQNNRLETFQKGFCGIDTEANSNQYITEYVLPQDCEMPLGIAVDDVENKVWYISTKKGLLGSYNLKEDKFDQEQPIPSWTSRESPREFSQVWDIEIDYRKRGGGESDVWFTDEKQNAIWRYIKSLKSFEKYNIPGKSDSFGTSYPISIEFDPNNKNIIYFVGTYSPSLWVADISEMKNGTSDGIAQIPIPIDEGFKGIDPFYITTGLIAFDNNRDAIWISVLSYAAQKGQIFKYDLDTKSFDVYDLPKEEEWVSSPWGLVVDDVHHHDGDLWITNPGTSIFFKLDPDDEDYDNNIVKFVTSKTSPRIYGDINTINSNSNISSIYKNSYTQPSWIKKSNDGSIWFKEQPENKIGKLEADDKNLPFSVDIYKSDKDLKVKRGESEKIEFRVKAGESPSFSLNSLNNIRMIASGTFTSTGDLGNSTGHFSEELISMDAGEEQKISFTFIPSTDLKPGDYTLMIGAENDSISYSRAVKIRIT